MNANTNNDGKATTASAARSMIRIGKDHHRAIRMAAASTGYGVSEMLEKVIEGDRSAVDLVAGFYTEGEA